jgi:hypothetical protein
VTAAVLKARTGRRDSALSGHYPQRGGVDCLSFAAVLVVLVLASGFTPVLSSGRTLELHVCSEVEPEPLVEVMLGQRVVVRRMVPPNPGKGQMRGPCDVGLVEINGGCWIGPIEGMGIPCATKFYEYNNKCYAPVAAEPNQPMSMNKGA